jgi:hypothetical protein
MREFDRPMSADASLLEVVEAVRGLDYGRPSDRSVEGMLREQCGTCSLKHLFLAEVLGQRFPQTKPQIMHRVYRLDRGRAFELFGEQVAEMIPDEGLVDVHRYLTAEIETQRIVIDATFPGRRWDGITSLPLACGPGEDFLAGREPDAEKRQLEAEYCAPAIREQFIEALTQIANADR